MGGWYSGIPVFQVLRKLRLEECHFKVSLGYFRDTKENIVSLKMCVLDVSISFLQMNV